MSPGDIVLVGFDPTVGNEQGGVRPAVVVSAGGYRRIVADRLVIVCPVTSRNRQLPHHVAIAPAPSHSLDRPAWVMCEQPRTISSQRLGRRLGRVTPPDLARVATVVRRLLHQPDGEPLVPQDPLPAQP